jgi:hypothetical protein
MVIYVLGKIKMQTELQKRMTLQDDLMNKLWSTLMNHVMLVNNNMSKAELLGVLELLKDRVLQTKGQSKMDIKIAELGEQI